MNITKEDGTVISVKVGDEVGFKYDVEQSGPIVSIQGSWVTVIATEGGYVHDDTCYEECEGCAEEIQVAAQDIWLD